MLSSSVEDLLGLGCHDGWGCLLPWLGDCLWGVMGLCVFGHSQCWLTILEGQCGELFGEVCFCCSPVGGLFGCFHFLGHLEIEGAYLKQKLLTQSF